MTELHCKIVEAIRKAAARHGSEALMDDSAPGATWGPTSGSLHIQDPERVGDVACVIYSFQVASYSLELIHWGLPVVRDGGFGGVWVVNYYDPDCLFDEFVAALEGCLLSAAPRQRKGGE
jgi:hypothetical protein